MKVFGGPPSLFVMLLGLAAVLGVGVAFNNVYVIALVPAVLVLAVAVAWPRPVLVAMVAYIPVESFLLKWLPGGASGPLSLVPETILFVAAAVAFLGSTRRDGQSEREKWLLWLAAFFAVCIVSAWLANVPWIDAVYWIRTNVRYMSAAFIVGALGNRRWWLGSVVPVVAGGLVLQAFIAVGEFLGGSAVRAFFAPGSMVVGGREFVDYAVTGPAGISGTLGFYNNLGVYSVLAMAACAGALVSVSESEELKTAIGANKARLLAVAVGAGALCVLLSASRQSVLILFASALALIMVVGPRRVGRRMVPAFAAFAIFAVAALLAPSLTGPLEWIPERFGQVVGGQAITQSLQTDRLFAIARVIPGMLAISPLLGLGPGTLASMSGVSSVASALSLGSESVAYVQDVGWGGMLFQVGLVGLGLFIGLFVWLARTARRLYRTGMLDRGAGASLAAAFTVWAAGMVASSPQLVRSTSLILWCVMGLCLGGYRIIDESVAEEAE